MPGGDLVVSAMNRYIDLAVKSGMTVYASRDWHPAVTSHFKPYGGPWPVHCVQDTPGAQFHPDLKLPPDAVIVTKGTHPDKPGYSAFDGEVAPGRIQRRLGRAIADIAARAVGDAAHLAGHRCHLAACGDDVRGETYMIFHGRQFVDEAPLDAA